MSSIIVIPNHLPHLDFLKEWKELSDQEIIVIQDIGLKPTVPKGFHNVTVYDHGDIRDELGEDSWIIPTETSACRSFGYYKAWQRKPDFIITLDNDCYPEQQDYFVEGHTRALGSQTTLDWIPSNSFMSNTRGMPYSIRNKSEVWLNHGLWSNVPDLDAATALQHPDLRFTPHYSSETIPRYNFFPMCGMNLSWRTELTPAMYFGIFGPEYGFDQYDDLWAGVLAKKVLDHLGYAAKTGYPSVEHRKQSNVFVNLKKQAPGLSMNEYFWREVQKIELTKENVLDCYEELIIKLPESIQDEPQGWTKQFKKAALIWVGLFKNIS